MTLKYSHNIQNLRTLLHIYRNTNRLKVCQTKSTLSHNPLSHSKINTPRPYNNTPTILGVTHDRGMTFKEHTDNKIKPEAHLSVLRALTDTYFSHNEQDIAPVYKQCIWPILSYLHPAWQPVTSDTHNHKLQITQITPLRIATGCSETNRIHHLHSETLVPPLKQHMRINGTHVYSSTPHLNI